jgi:hypothetical protein
MHDERNALIGKLRLLTDVRRHQPDTPIRIRDANADPDAHANPASYAEADSVAQPHANRYAQGHGFPHLHAAADSVAQPHAQADSHGHGKGGGNPFHVRIGVGLGVRE